MKKLFTIGYEGAALADFLALLDKENIDILLDIREAPVSRRKEFSKNALCEALVEFDIEYRHEKSLGTPKVIRDKFRKEGDDKAFFEAFNRHLQKQKLLLQKLAGELSGNIALMCYEKDHNLCHRSSVANALGEILNLLPEHLEVNNNELRETHQMSFLNF